MVEEVSWKASPFENLNKLTSGNGLRLLKGDTAKNLLIDGVGLIYWEDWKQALVILDHSLALGVSLGSVFAYLALCNQLAVLIMGIIKLVGYFGWK